MPEMSLHVLFHASCNVEAGLFPARGRGFQTVAVSEELIGTEDLKRLEDLATYYEVNAERRSAGDLPVKRSFFRLPSGKFALGETVDWGAGPSGRPGNYLARHLIVEGAELAAADGPRAIGMDAWERAGGVDPDQPRRVPGIQVPAQRVSPEASILPGLPLRMVESLLAHACAPGERTALLVGEEERSYGAIRDLLALLPPSDLLSLPFTTHFYRACDALRPHFRLAAIRSWSEAPSGRQAYLVFDLEQGEEPGLPVNAYVRWLAGAAMAGKYREIELMNGLIEDSRRNVLTSSVSLPEDSSFLAALWERTGAAAVPLFPRGAEFLVKLLGTVSQPRALADALLEAGSPAELCGPAAAPDVVKRLLTELRQQASPRSWKQWSDRWPNEPGLAAFRTPAWAFWKR